MFVFVRTWEAHQGGDGIKQCILLSHQRIPVALQKGNEVSVMGSGNMPECDF